MQAGFAALFFWFHLENYVRVILLVCALHSLVTFEFELVDGGEVAYACGVWFVTTLGPLCGLLLILGGLGYGAQRVWQHQSRTFLCLLSLICATHALVLLYLSSDFFFATQSSWLGTEQGGVFYLHPKTGLTYDRGYGVEDQFE